MLSNLQLLLTIERQMASAIAAHLGIPSVTGGGAGGGHSVHDVRRAECREPRLPCGSLVRPDCVENALLEHDENCAEGFRVEDIVEGDSGEVTAVADEEWFLDKLGFLRRATVLWRGKDI